MPRRDSGRRRFEFLQERDSRWPISPRIVLGALAIAVMVLAFALRPGQQIQDTGNAAPEPRPTYAAAAIVPIPTSTTLISQAAAPTATPSAGAGQRIHTVASGDTLTALAKKYYGDSSKWQRILDANKDVLKSANSLSIGQKLKIPE